MLLSTVPWESTNPHVYVQLNDTGGLTLGAPPPPAPISSRTFRESFHERSMSERTLDTSMTPFVKRYCVAVQRQRNNCQAMWMRCYLRAADTAPRRSLSPTTTQIRQVRGRVF